MKKIYFSTCSWCVGPLNAHDISPCHLFPPLLFFFTIATNFLTLSFLPVSWDYHSISIADKCSSVLLQTQTPFVFFNPNWCWYKQWVRSVGCMELSTHFKTNQGPQLNATLRIQSNYLISKCEVVQHLWLNKYSVQPTEFLPSFFIVFLLMTFSLSLIPPLLSKSRLLS